MKRRLLLFLFLITLSISATALGRSALASPVPTDEEIQKILTERLGDNSNRVGIVVGVIQPAGRRIVAHGSLAENDKRPLNGNTVFEIGSITKVFTSLLLADMAQRGEVALTDPVEKHLPPGVKMPERGNRKISLEDLARHRSGLPRLPTNMMNENIDPKNPYASYSANQLYDFLSTYQLPRDIGARFEYSNLGGGLLGHVLSLSAGKDYETLIRTRICRPLAMRSTAITLSTDLKSRLATGHDNRFLKTANWDIPTLAGGGALRSTVIDMLSFLAAQIELGNTTLGPAIQATRSAWTPAGTGMEIGLGWLKREKNGSTIIWHNGGTGGYRSFAGFDPAAKTGVVVLTNVSPQAGVDDIGFHLLDPESKLLPADSPLLQPPKARKEITLDPASFKNYVGRYQLAPGAIFTVTQAGNQLYVQLTGQHRFKVFPESERKFFYKAVDAQITFEADGDSPATALVLHQAGQNPRAPRIAE